MINELSHHRYEVHLHVAVQGPDDTQVDGMTEYISNRVIRFAVDDPFALKPGTRVALLVALPREITAGNPVMIRARGTVLRVQCMSSLGGPRLTFTARVEKLDFVRPDGLAEVPLSEPPQRDWKSAGTCRFRSSPMPNSA